MHMRLRMPRRRRQDPAVVGTGGCVWETAYLLSLWAVRELLPMLAADSRVRCLEVGAGCGLLGLTLAGIGAQVVLTETPDAMPNLRWNVEHNQPARRGSARAQTLHWGDDADIAAVVRHGPFDVLVGTDVVYVSSPRCLSPPIAC